MEGGKTALTLRKHSKSFFKYSLVTQRGFALLVKVSQSFAIRSSGNFLVLLLGIFYSNHAIGQQAVSFGIENIRNVIPPSPEASSLGKYADVPVSLYTGIPQVSIPIYTIQEKGIQIPISLNYHAGGVRVEEHASWVGLGWSLNAGGIITRSVVGGADDQNGGYLTQTNDLENLGSLSVDELKRIKADVSANTLDIEPDIYSFSFLGQSEKFIVDKATRTGIASKKTNLKIEIINTLTENRIKGWKITDDRGNQYLFEDIETSDVTSFNPDGRGASVRQRYVSSWYLSKIVLSNRSEITFLYQSHTSGYHTRQGASKYLFLEAGQATCERPASDYDKYLAHTITGKHVESIWFSSGHVKFVPGGEVRQDMLGDYWLDRVEVYNFQNSSQPIKKWKLGYSYFNSNEHPNTIASGLGLGTNFRLKLEKVEEIGSSNGKSVYRLEYFPGELPSVFSNSQDHWGFYNGVDNPSLVPLDQIGYGSSSVSRAVNFTMAKIGTLSKIHYPTGGYTQFDYESNEASISDSQYKTYFYPYGPISLQYYESFGGSVYKDPDSGEESKLIDTIYVRPDAKRLDLFNNIEYSVQLDRQNCNGGDRLCSGTLRVILTCIDCEDLPPSSFTLNSGQFVEGICKGTIYLIPGKTYSLRIDRGYEFPSVRADIRGLFFKPPSSNPGKMNILAGGLRVKRVDSYASPTEQPISTRYYYNKGIDFVPETSTTYESSGILTAFPVYDSYNTFLQVRGGNASGCLYKLRTANTRLPLGGMEGTVVGYSDVQTYKTDGIEKIKTISSFYSSVDYPDVIDYSFPFAVIQSRSNLRGMLKREVKYLWKANQFIPASESENLYLSSGYQYSPGVRSGVSTFVPSDMGDGDWQYKIYELPSEFVYLKNSLSTSYDGNGGNPITTETDYSYENPSHYNVTKTEFTQSKGHLTLTEYKYPHDFQTNPIYQAMVGRYIVGPVVEQTQLNATLNKPISKVVTDFDLWNSNTFIDVKAVKKAEGGNALETEIIVNEYDANGNVVQYTERSGAVVTILWGYQSQYPVAKIINATYAQAKAVVTQNILDNPTDDASLRAHLNALRSIGGAQVSTYTYKPLIGKTSETDVNSRSVFYQYDEFNRLSVIKDHEGKIIKRICYNYAGQVDDCSDSPSYQLTGITRCKPCEQNSLYTSQILQNERRDMNPNSPTYSQASWVDAGSSPSCITAVWVATATPIRCVKDGNNQNTGNIEREEMDINPCSATLNQRKWVFAEHNPAICPLPVVCNTSNCSGIDKRCVNGACETGVLVVDTYERDEMGRCLKYYHYEWSDSSQSGQYSQAATSSLCN